MLSYVTEIHFCCRKLIFWRINYNINHLLYHENVTTLPSCGSSMIGINHYISHLLVNHHFYARSCNCYIFYDHFPCVPSSLTPTSFKQLSVCLPGIEKPGNLHSNNFFSRNFDTLRWYIITNFPSFFTFYWLYSLCKAKKLVLISASYPHVYNLH